ncbi:Lipopolysaccharide export system permease protein LptF [Candidatus Ecksteinia adelgidicola]|nr:Lipopolysaccharide export system permease protein LptF [Candidatus Ecksteinia adelgidicola]
MIIIKYLVKETIKRQIPILFILLLIFCFQSLIKILYDTINNNFPTSLTLYFLLLSVPKIIQYILPLSLFLGLFMTYRRLYSECEILAMEACGFRKYILLITAIILSIFTSFFSVINVFLLSPIALRDKETIITQIQNNLNISRLKSEQFKFSQIGNTVFFIEKIENNIFHNIFIVQFSLNKNQYPAIILSKQGSVDLKDNGLQIITLNKGTYFKDTVLLHHLNMIDFNNYRKVIKYNKKKMNNIKFEKMLIKTLYQSNDLNIKAEFFWRITLVFSILIMALFAVPLNFIQSNKDDTLNMLLPILLYLIFFLLQISCHSNINIKAINRIIFLWIVNILYFFIAVILNLKYIIPPYKLYSFLRKMR